MMAEETDDDLIAACFEKQVAFNAIIKKHIELLIKRVDDAEQRLVILEHAERGSN